LPAFVRAEYNARAAEAVELLEHVVKIRSSTLAEMHPHRLTSQHELAYAYLKTGRAAEAVELLEHVVKIRSSTLADTQPHRLASRHLLTQAYSEKNKAPETM
jgi:hypothetical protein